MNRGRLLQSMTRVLLGDLLCALQLTCHRILPFTDSIYSEEVVLRDGTVSYQGLTQYKLAMGSVRLFAKMLLKRRVFAILSMTQPDQQTLR